MLKRKLVTAATLLAVAAAGPAAAQVKRHTDIKYPKLKDFKIRKPEIYTMGNGMKVFLMEDHELPLINVSMRVRTGSNYEPAGKTGLGGIFAQVLREGGTKTMSGDEIDEYLALRAASVETGMGGDVGFASANSLVDTFDDTLKVLADVLRNPVFAEDKLEVAKSQANSAIARRNDAIAGITGREFNRLIYGQDSPIGRLNEYATIAAITRDDLMAWHKRYYHPNNMYVGVVGDFDPQAMKKKLERTFGGWEKGPAADLGKVAYQETMRPGVYSVEKDDVTQAYVRLGHLGRKMQVDDDHFAITVMNEVLSGSFASRLFSNVRSKKGLAYSVFGGVGSGMARKGIFQVGLSTKSETMAEAVEALREEVVGIIERPATPVELDRAKESILNSFVFSYDSESEILNQQMTYDYYGLPADYLDIYQDRIAAVTADDVARVAREYIHPEKLTLLVVGKSEEFDRPVASFGDEREVDIAIAPPADDAPEIERTATTLEQGRKLFGKVVDHMSNGARGKFRSMTADYTIAFKMGGQTMEMGQKLSLVLPDKIRQTIKLPMGEQLVVVNGSDGYMAMGGNRQPLPAAMIEESRKEIVRGLVQLVNHRDDPSLEAVAGGESKVLGTSCRMLAVSVGGVESRFCVGANGAVLSQRYQGKHPMEQRPGTMEVVFSEYKPLDGRMLPTKQVLHFEGEELATITTNSVQFDPSIDESQFSVN